MRASAWGCMGDLFFSIPFGFSNVHRCRLTIVWRMLHIPPICRLRLGVWRTVLAVCWRRTDQVAVLPQNYRCPRYKAELQLCWCEYYASDSASVAAMGVLIAYTSIPMVWVSAAVMKVSIIRIPAAVTGAYGGLVDAS